MELKASDLRIGNLVYLLKNNEKRIYNMGALDIYKSDESDCADIEPIPLTPEILVKAGFDRLDNVWINGIALYQNSNGCFNYNASFFEYDNLIEIKFVHSLQNLYFCLHEKEIIFK